MGREIPRVVIGATQSGSGKTTLVTGLLAALRGQGLRVQAYKVGPDYIDPGYHAIASGRPAHNLDTWLLPKGSLPGLLARTSEGADIAVIEGVMGLYDGGRGGVSSTAEIAKLLDAPVLLAVDAKSMGASAAAVALGFRAYDPDVRLAGVLLNRVGSPTHEAMLREAMAGIGMPVLGALRRDSALALPERHLGLLPAEESRAEEAVRRMGSAVGAQLDLAGIVALARTAPPLELSAGAARPAARPSPACRIAVARDEAFSFYYPESLAVLEELGAEIVPFSPLRDEALPAADGLLLGGGFPEVFAGELERNAAMRASVRQAAASGMPVYGECGGYMYLMRELAGFDGRVYAMAGAIPARARMQERLQMVGYVEAELLQDSLLGARGQKLRGHEFHFSAEQAEEGGMQRAFRLTRMRNGSMHEAGYASGNLLGSYLHLHFAGCPEAARSLVGRCRAYRAGKGQG